MLADVKKVILATTLLSLVTPHALPAAPVAGSFIQLNRASAVRTAKQWSDDIEQMASVGIDSLVVQWSAEEGIAYFTNSLPFGEHYLAVENILDSAEKQGMRVYLGLQHDPHYWNHIAGRPRVLKDYFYVRVAQNEKLQKEMLARFAGHAAWRGYYICDEIDDINWRVPEKTGLMKGYLAQLSERLRANDDHRTILVSAFYRMRTAPDVFAENLKELLTGSHIGAVLVQDGLGDGISWKYAERYVPIYYKTLQDTLSDPGIELWAVIETFKRTSEDGEPFEAASAAPDRVKRQISMAKPFFKSMVYFTFPDYVDPDLGRAGKALFDALKSDETSSSPASAERPEDK